MPKTENEKNINSFHDIEEDLRKAAKNRNKNFFGSTIDSYVNDHIITKLKELTATHYKDEITLEGFSLHLLSHAIGDWIRLPHSLNDGKVGAVTLGAKFFSQNVYAKFYERYFRKIPTDFLVSLSDLDYPLKHGAASSSQKSEPNLHLFNKPTLVSLLCDGSNTSVMANTSGKRPFLSIAQETIENIGNKTFLKNKDAFQEIIDACHKYPDYLEYICSLDDLRFLYTRYSPDDKWLKDNLPSSNSRKKFKQNSRDFCDIITVFKEAGFFDQIKTHNVRKDIHDKDRAQFNSEFALAFMLSFYFIFTTEYKDIKLPNKEAFFYTYPIKGSYTGNKKRGVFFLAFSGKEPELDKETVNSFLDKIDVFFENESKNIYGVDSKICLEADATQGQIRLEELLVKCSNFSKRHVDNLGMNRARGVILDSLKEKNDDAREFCTKMSNNEPELKKGWPEKITGYDPIKKITGASEKYCSFLRHLLETARTNYNKDKEKDNFQESQCIFIYSPPGCGKETLAKLIHLVARTPICLKRSGDELELKPQINIHKLDHLRSQWVVETSALPKYVKYPLNIERIKALGPNKHISYYLDRKGIKGNDLEGDKLESFKDGKKFLSYLYETPDLLENANGDIYYKKYEKKKVMRMK